MWRRAFHVAAAVSFVLCVAVHVFWLRSYLYSEKVAWSGTRGWRCVQTEEGRFVFGLHWADWSGGPATRFQGPAYQREEHHPAYRFIDLLCSSSDDIDIDWALGSFAWHAKLNFKQDDHYSTIGIPCWFLGAATLVLPLVLTTRRLRSRSP